MTSLKTTTLSARADRGSARRRTAAIQGRKQEIFTAPTRILHQGDRAISDAFPEGAMRRRPGRDPPRSASTRADQDTMRLDEPTLPLSPGEPVLAIDLHSPGTIMFPENPDGWRNCNASSPSLSPRLRLPGPGNRDRHRPVGSFAGRGGEEVG